MAWVYAVADAPEVPPKTWTPNRRINMKYTYETRLDIVSKVKSGSTIRGLGREYGVHPDRIIEWVRLYDQYGPDSLRERPKIIKTGQLKERAVREILEKGLSLSQALVKYRVSRTSLAGWVRKARECGYEALHITQSGRKVKTTQTMGRPKKKEPQTELEKLQAENLRLRAENALLKKVRALVEEQNARARLNGQKPSTD